jgi:AmiR/NasT family two-component response regulator
LNSRVTIEQAKGALSERLGVSVEEAFDRLRAYARSGSRRLSEVAHQVVHRDLDPAVFTATQRPGTAPVSRDLDEP